MDDILSHWFKNPSEAVRNPLHQSRGFSGSHHWQVDAAGRQFVLRRWAHDFKRDRLAPIHAVQSHLAASGLPVPAPVLNSDGETLLESRGSCWELSPWMPGFANYWSDPRPAKLTEALSMLARLHLAAANVPASIRPNPTYVSPAFQNRAERLRALNLGGLDELQSIVGRLPPCDEKNLATEIVTLAAKLLPLELQKIDRWRDRQLPTQWCLRDIWHDHVLFTDDQVTGVIDFGAASLDTPAVDIVRLLGSMVGDDRHRWQLGLDAYESVRPLTDDEREAIPHLDSSAVLLSPLNWVRWLYGSDSPLALSLDRSAALQRLRRHAQRLRTLAASA
jgi:homoserine kinase type II